MEDIFFFHYFSKLLVAFYSSLTSKNFKKFLLLQKTSLNNFRTINNSLVGVSTLSHATRTLYLGHATTKISLQKSL